VAYNQLLFYFFNRRPCPSGERGGARPRATDRDGMPHVAHVTRRAAP
jgi:hypothetical protein